MNRALGEHAQSQPVFVVEHVFFGFLFFFETEPVLNVIDLPTKQHS